MIADCQRLYLENKGLNYRRIEAEMHSLGWTEFRRWVLCPTKKQPGWIRLYNWAEMLHPVDRMRRQKYRAAAGVFQKWLRMS